MEEAKKNAQKFNQEKMRTTEDLRSASSEIFHLKQEVK